MSDVATSENQATAQTLRDIVACLGRREEIRVALGNESKAGYDAQSGAVSEAIAGLIRTLKSEEWSLLGLLVGLLENVERSLRASGTSIGSLDPIRHFKPFQMANRILATDANTLKHHYSILSRSTAEHAKGPIEDIVFTAADDDRVWQTFDVALDLLQYLELFLRHQTKLECADLSRGVRRSRWRRAPGTVFRDALTREIKTITSRKLAGADRRTADAQREEISKRLERVLMHLTERETRRTQLERFTPRDQEPSAPSYKDLERQVQLYHDELSLLLSELVQLHDNVFKWLKAHRRSQHELSIVERLPPYRVAACYVGPAKHGGRDRNKTSALGDDVIEFLSDSEGPGGPHLIDADPIINYEGERWQGSIIVDDLIQLWELFLRNHTDVDTTTFRVEIGKRLAPPQLETNLDARSKSKASA
jgi:hypothetical protein